MAPAPPLSARAQSATVRGLAALPDGVLRRIVGRPVVRDGQCLDVEAQLGLRLLALAGEKTLADSTVAEARARVAQDAATFEGPKLEVASVSELTVDGPDGPLAARLYVPPRSAEPAPLLTYFHGGGFVVGDLDTHDNVCRFLARQSGMRVLSVDYRLAPEHPFPAPIEDAVAAFRFAVEHASELGVDPGRIAVGGDSAGGNLAAGVAAQASASGGPAPAFQLLLYPWLDLTSERPSYDLFGEGFYLTRSDLRWYRTHYVPDASQASNPRCSPIAAVELGGVAPAYIATAGFDPLRDEGEEYARRLREAGARVALRRHSGLIHGFANTTAIGRAAREAVLEATGALQMALA
jgi:acetyl esterase